MRSTLEALRELVLAQVPDAGMHPTAIPYLFLNRLETPIVHKRVGTRGVSLAVIVQGAKRVTIGDRTMEYRPGDYLFVTGEQRYWATVPDATPQVPYLSLALALPPDDVAAVLLELDDAGAGGSDGDGDDAPAYVDALYGPLLDALVRLVATLSDPVERRVLAPAIVREVIFRLLRSDGAAALRRLAGRRDPRIQRALAFMREHAVERLTVDRLAREVAMSPSHFAHRFREVVRVSPMQFVRHLRLDQARRLLVSDGLGAAEVAARVGYGSPSHFSRDFKAQFGQPPRAYAKQFRRASVAGGSPSMRSASSDGASSSRPG